MLKWQYIFQHHKQVSEMKKLQRKAHDKSRNLLPLHFLPRNRHWSRKRNRNAGLFEKSMESSVRVHLSLLASRAFWVAARDVWIQTPPCLGGKPEISRTFLQYILQCSSRNGHKWERKREDCLYVFSDQCFPIVCISQCHTTEGCPQTRIKKSREGEGLKRENK